MAVAYPPVVASHPTVEQLLLAEEEIFRNARNELHNPLSCINHENIGYANLVRIVGEKVQDMEKRR